MNDGPNSIEGSQWMSKFEVEARVGRLEAALQGYCGGQRNQEQESHLRTVPWYRECHIYHSYQLAVEGCCSCTKGASLWL